MNVKKCCKVGAYGTIISGLCCLGLLGILLGVFGATVAIAYVNTFGDFIFLPAYGIFATLFVYSLFKLRKNWLTYPITTVVAGLAIYVSLSLTGVLLTGGGILAGVILIALLRRRI